MNPFIGAAAGVRQGIDLADKQRLMGGVLVLVHRHVVDATPEISGQLKRGTTYGLLPNGDGFIRNDVAYALAVHDGARPHTIRASGKSLAFAVGGQMVFPQSVRHPGNRPNPFMARGLASSVPSIATLLGGWGDAVLAGMLKR